MLVTTNAKSALLKHFNVSNRIHPNVELSDVTWGPPEIWLQGECNSRIEIRAAAASNGFAGTETIYFKRRRIEDDLRGVRIPGKPDDYVRFFDVLKVLREKMGIPLLNDEFLDRNLVGSTVKIDVTAVSMAYIPGGSVTLTYAG